MLEDIELLAEEARRSARRSTSFEPESRIARSTQFVGGQRHRESTKYKRALGLSERLLVPLKTIDVALTSQFVGHGFDGCLTPRLAGGNGGAD
jgi:hypothetical protein